VFIAGNWKNYDELEEQLSLPELLETRKAVHDQERRHNVFMASLKGIDLEKEERASDEVVDRVRQRVAERLGKTGDITELQGKAAEKMGFGIGYGIEYEEG
jgi:triosephosphate isomerase